MATAFTKVLMSSIVLVPLFLLPMFTARVTAEPKTTRMARMPIFYGKRSTQQSSGGAAELSEWYKSLGGRKRHSLTEPSGDNRHNKYESYGELVMIERLLCRVHPSLFNSLCSIFKQLMRLPKQMNNVEKVKRKYSALSRMPGYFGKRSFTPSELDVTTSREFDDSVEDKPAFYDKIALSNLNLEILNREDDGDKMLKRNALRRMPNFYGKREYNSPTLESQNWNNMKTIVKKVHSYSRPTLSRAVLRFPSEKYGRHRDIVFTLLYLLGNRGVPSKVSGSNENKTADSDINVTKIKEDKTVNDNKGHIAMINFKANDDNSLTNDEETKFHNSKRHYFSHLDRMPHFFGKREYISFLATPTYRNDSPVTSSGRDDNLGQPTNFDNIIKLTALLNANFGNEKRVKRKHNSLHQASETSKGKFEATPKMSIPKLGNHIQDHATDVSDNHMSDVLTGHPVKLPLKSLTRTHSSNNVSKLFEFLHRKAQPGLFIAVSDINVDNIHLSQDLIRDLTSHVEDFV